MFHSAQHWERILSCCWRTWSIKQKTTPEKKNKIMSYISKALYFSFKDTEYISLAFFEYLSYIYSRCNEGQKVATLLVQNYSIIIIILFSIILFTKLGLELLNLLGIFLTCTLIIYRLVEGGSLDCVHRCPSDKEPLTYNTIDKKGDV